MVEPPPIQPDFGALQRLDKGREGIPKSDLDQANRLMFGADRRNETEDLHLAFGRLAEIYDRWTVIMIAKALGPLNEEIRRMAKKGQDDAKAIAKLKAERKALKKRIVQLKKNAKAS